MMIMLLPIFSTSNARKCNMGV